MSQPMSTTTPNPMFSPDSVTVSKPYLGRAGPVGYGTKPSWIVFGAWIKI